MTARTVVTVDSILTPQDVEALQDLWMQLANMADMALIGARDTACKAVAARQEAVFLHYASDSAPWLHEPMLRLFKGMRNLGDEKVVDAMLAILAEAEARDKELDKKHQAP